MNPYSLFKQFRNHRNILYLCNFFGTEFILPEDRIMNKKESGKFTNIITVDKKADGKQGEIETWFMLKLYSENSYTSN